eukprot:2693262-Amphidinium_carterae.1
MVLCIVGTVAALLGDSLCLEVVATTRRLAASHGAHLLLSGLGSEEAFAGYERHQANTDHAASANGRVAS